jgi:conjugal transfer/entry exclusion protein
VMQSAQHRVREHDETLAVACDDRSRERSRRFRETAPNADVSVTTRSHPEC